MPPERRALVQVLIAIGAAVATVVPVAVGKVSHAGWPRINGIHWSARTGGHRTNGTPRNDELLGKNGSDWISGGAGDDVLWGDSLPSGQPTTQVDHLNGGPGNDWIYSSHGTNYIKGGPGNDHVFVYYGRGTVDCGPGRDVVWVRRLAQSRHYRLRNCEIVKTW